MAEVCSAIKYIHIPCRIRRVNNLFKNHVTDINLGPNPEALISSGMCIPAIKSVANVL